MTAGAAKIAAAIASLCGSNATTVKALVKAPAAQIATGVLALVVVMSASMTCRITT